jgi:solute carrier family 35 (GDP-fucose transporter), member C1
VRNILLQLLRYAEYFASNKAVLNGSPDLPLLFLFIQLVMAVVLLHGAALFSTKIEIPKPDMDVAKKLVPVVAVNIIGLVFNTLCLRDVEASFFQVCGWPLFFMRSNSSSRSLEVLSFP